MQSNVHYTNIQVNKECSSPAIGVLGFAQQNVHMAKQRHFLREWRTHSGKTLVQVAEHLHMTHGYLSKIERGLHPYNQELLEALSALYMCEPADLIVRDPTASAEIWTIWDQAKPGDRAKIVTIAKTIVDGEEDAAVA